MNGIIAAVQGRIPKDAQPLRYTANGRAFLGFSLAVNDEKRGENDPTEWVRVTLWGELAEQLDGALTKGREVYCEGRLRLKSWTTAEGIDRPSIEISAWTCQLLGAVGRRRRAGHGRTISRTARARCPKRWPSVPAATPAGNSGWTTTPKAPPMAEIRACTPRRPIWTPCRRCRGRNTGTCPLRGVPLSPTRRPLGSPDRTSRPEGPRTPIARIALRYLRCATGRDAQ